MGDFKGCKGTNIYLIPNDFKLGTPIICAALLRVVGINRMIEAVAGMGQARGCDTMGDKVLINSIGTVGRQFKIVGFRADIVGMAAEFNLKPGILLQEGQQLLQFHK